MAQFKVFCTAILISLSNLLMAQAPTLVINEVSNGMSGTREYIELLVVGPPSQPCSPPETLDLRKWIIDDNNGFLGSGSGNGIASGAFRFKDDPFWANIPVGTLILIYNHDDYENSLITNDLSMTDGNCSLVIPHNSNLLESQSDTPTTSNSSYPSSGWSTPSSWNPLGLRNGGDGVLIFNPNNTNVPVFSLGYGDVNINNADVGFTGSGGGMVYAMENIQTDDFYAANNWSQKNADLNTQTPGLPNNPSNASYITSLNNGCQPSSSASITPNNISALCVGESLSLTASPAGGVWTSNQPSVATVDSNGMVTALSQGTVVIEYVVGDCSANITIDVGAEPTASFYADPTVTDLSNTMIDFDNQSSNATDYIWDFGDGTAPQTTENPSHTFPNDEPGSYTVTLIAFNDYNCSDTTHTTIYIESIEEELPIEPMTYLIPNVFTPNGDGNNDFFTFVHHKNIEEIDLVIVNRWGNVVYESNDVNFSWNGKVMNNGEECSEGVYFYLVKLKNVAFEEVVENGHIQLIKGK